MGQCGECIIVYCICLMRGQTTAAAAVAVGSEVGQWLWAWACGRVHVHAADLYVGKLWWAGQQWEQRGVRGLPDRKLDKLAAQRKCMKCAT